MSVSTSSSFSSFTDAFLAELPKTDLHMHLDGSMRISTIIDLAKKNNVELPDYTVEGLKEKVRAHFLFVSPAVLFFASLF